MSAGFTFTMVMLLILTSIAVIYFRLWKKRQSDFLSVNEDLVDFNRSVERGDYQEMLRIGKLLVYNGALDTKGLIHIETQLSKIPFQDDLNTDLLEYIARKKSNWGHKHYDSW